MPFTFQQCANATTPFAVSLSSVHSLLASPFYQISSNIPSVSAFLPGCHLINTCPYVAEIRIYLLSTINKKTHLKEFYYFKTDTFTHEHHEVKQLSHCCNSCLYTHIQGCRHRALAISDLQTTTCLLAFILVRVFN